MRASSFKSFDPTRTPSPCYVVDRVAVEHNLKILQQVQEASGARILLALKAFSMHALAPLVSQYLKGCCASGLNEARLAYEKFGGNAEGDEKREVHVYSPAYREDEFDELTALVDHMVFNCVAQWQRYRDKLQTFPNIKAGIRINPRVSTGQTPLYDPCATGSRLGTHAELFFEQLGGDFEGISGLHFHTLCEQGYAPLAETLQAVEAQFADILPKLEWLNFGGGHHITQPGYDLEGLIACIKHLQEKYDLQVYLEPGEAVAINSGVLVSEVLDLHENGMPIAILDTSATCHMPDTLEMPYRADLIAQNPVYDIAAEANQKLHTYRVAGQTCLAGDVMGDYSFNEPLKPGQRLMFDDMAHYTMVKTTTFNGIGLPALAIWDSATDQLDVLKTFGYDDFVGRLS